MEIDKRGRLIDEYYRSLDADEYEVFEELFTETSEHIRPGQGVLEGGATVRTYYVEERDATDMTHAVQERFHGDSGTLCIVNVSGEDGDGPFAHPIVGEFRFDDETETIASYRVYRGAPSDPRLED